MGSMALGSLVMAFFQFLHLLLAWLDARSRPAQRQNACLSGVFKCLHVGLWLVRKVLQFIDRCVCWRACAGACAGGMGDWGQRWQRFRP